MNAAASIPEPVLARQREASNPAVSVWVSANAGSGKTFVLAQRVIRLLLGRTDPAKILCLTFTKAAAANMAKIVFDTLAEWTTLDDKQLDERIRGMTNECPDNALRGLARRLFATALETPGGLKVQTIHAFCTRLLQQFPFEADVAARFEVLDDPTQRALLEETSLGVLLEAANAPDSALGKALATAIALASDYSFRSVIDEAIAKRDAVRAWTDRAGSVDAAILELCGTLAIDADDALDKVEEEIVNGPILPRSEWAAVAALCKVSTPRDQDQCERLTKAERASGSERIDAYLDIFIDSKKQPRANLLTRDLCKKNPQLAERLAREQARVLPLRERRKATACRDRTAAVLTIVSAIIERYRKEKERRGLLDYDDLLDKARELLMRTESAWVHYKLDLGVDHVLIDEAQDTSPKQWDVVGRLVDEFAAGAGARGALCRTIFAVGDDKQSIYSFQGAAPHKFSDMRRHFETRFRAAVAPVQNVTFQRSFRSLPVILEAVDTVFARPEAFGGLSADRVATVHEAVRGQAPGFVEIWPLVEPEERPAIEGWDAPFDTSSETSPRVKLARRIAGAVRDMLRRGDRVGDGDKRHAVTPGDILILVRQRGPLFEAIIRALKNADVAVAGADRLVLTEHIAVMDLMALADALLLPHDDLALATVLRSPLFGFTDGDLFDVAWNRGPISLRSALAGKSAEKALFAEAAVQLDALADAARRETPFAFYARLLGAGQGRRRFLARLGLEANDALDEFLNLALDYEQREAASLQGFVAWLRSANAEVKRDMEIARDEVRVMTVHGAKGLEAPIVILADTTTPPAGPTQHQPRLLRLADAGSAPDARGHLVWSARKDDDTAIMAQSRLTAVAANEDEYRRLLYVAMTRAADRLIVCGALGQRKAPEGCWYDLVWDALKEASIEEQDGEATVWRFRKPAPDDVEDRRPPATDASAEKRTEFPAWLQYDAPPEMPRAVPVSPSAAYDEQVAARTDRTIPPAARFRALERGRLVHRLMQSLPDIPPAHRAAAARQFLARGDNGFSEAERDEIAQRVFAMLDDPRFAPLFAPGSRAEVSIVGRLARDSGEPIPVAGQVDRLTATGDSVLIVDYKTNRLIPRDAGEVPPAYIAQFALYRAVLARLYPDKPVRAALVWTEGPELMEISPAVMDAAIVQVLAAKIAPGEAPLTLR